LYSYLKIFGNAQLSNKIAKYKFKLMERIRNMCRRTMEEGGRLEKESWKICTLFKSNSSPKLRAKILINKYLSSVAQPTAHSMLRSGLLTRFSWSTSRTSSTKKKLPYLPDSL